MQVFEELIKETGKKLGIPMTTDRNMACRLNFSEHKVQMQIDLFPDGERFLITAEVGEILPGPLRERFFRAALKYNGAHQDKGIFAFSEKKNVLLAYRFFSINAATAEEISTFLKDFVLEIKVWKESLERGETPQIEGMQITDGGLFGLPR
jgi:hypothetical protein